MLLSNEPQFLHRVASGSSMETLRPPTQAPRPGHQWQQGHRHQSRNVVLSGGGECGIVRLLDCYRYGLAYHHILWSSAAGSHTRSVDMEVQLGTAAT